MDELLQWNSRINLTGLSERKRILNELFLDSLIPTPFVPDSGRMLDVGSGAGFPGIVIKIYYPRLKALLIESNSKKTSFLRQVIRLLKLEDIGVFKGRIEMTGEKLHPDGYHLITARALAALDRVIAYCSPFLSYDGLLIGFLGSNAEKALEKSRASMEANFLFIDKLIPYSLPGMDSKRTLVILKKKASI